MGRPTNAERVKLRAKIEILVKQDLSTSEIGRMTGKSAQAIHQYLRRNGLMTKEMARRAEINLDNDSDVIDKEDAHKEREDER
jgi:predicted DNA-binding protein YlxM (UPF0122 family)